MHMTTNDTDTDAARHTAHWNATQDRQPPTPHTLRVEGMPHMPSPGHTPVLTRAEPQGFNPRILVLTLTAMPPARPSSPAVTPVVARYEERSSREYELVQIRSFVPTEPDALLEIEVLQ
jgi:hypothetical protein